MSLRPGDGLAWLDAHVNFEALNTPVGESRRAAHPTLDRITDLDEGTRELANPQAAMT